jgi:two-component system, NtrC family, nitrogen regulation response regulator GlnG
MTDQVILVADDDRAIRTVLEQALGRSGYDVRSTDNASTLWRWVSEGEGDLVITDVVMPDGNGLDLLPQMRQARPELPILVMSAQNNMMTAIKAAERGAYEYLPKPFDLIELAGVIERALSTPKGVTERKVNTDEEMPLIGRSAAMQEIYRLLARLMSTDLTVLISGESGTGKELVAKALHDYGKRKRGPFVAVNMAAIPRELIESELFGHEKGAFTGANNRGVGRFEQAESGTLFLDEIGDMPLEAQTRLLRVLQQGEYTTVGGRVPIRTNVRIVAATNRNLRQLVRQGLFREDLFYRLNVVPLRLPSLRDRAEDIADLAVHFLSLAAEEGLPLKNLTPEAFNELSQYAWPGNVRELENLIRRLAALYAEDTIDVGVIRSELAEANATPHDIAGLDNESLGEAVERHLNKYFAAHSDGLPPDGLYDRILHEIERPLISISLEATRGNQIKAAGLLGLNRNTLRKKIRELDIPVIRSGK